MKNKKTSFTFPVGYHEFHKDQVFNFQLNRWYSLGYTRFEDMVEAGKKIETFADWKHVMLRLAEKALVEKRFMNAAFYYRAAEFYTFREEPEKEILYDKFVDLFYRTVAGDGIERCRVPYLGTFLPALRVRAAGKRTRGHIVMHGGFDSYIEEFYSSSHSKGRDRAPRGKNTDSPWIIDGNDQHGQCLTISDWMM
jgi:hypothetical protein